MEFNGAVLVVEDDPNDVLLFQCALGPTCLGSRICFVADGIEARKYLEGAAPYDNRARHPLPAILIMDLMMPRMNGFELLKWIREQPGLRDLFVVVLTGMDRAASMNQAYAMGANLYLVKPLHYSELAGVLACATLASTGKVGQSNLSLLPA